MWSMFLNMKHNNFRGVQRNLLELAVGIDSFISAKILIV